MNISTVNELIQSLESAGELTIREEKFLKLAKAYADQEAESVAQALTIEKCREITNCPDGVDLQDWVKQLAAENVGLKQAAEFATAQDMWEDLGGDVYRYHYVDWYVDKLKSAIENPATDSIYAGIKASIEYPKNNSSSKGWTIDPEFLSRVSERAGAFYGYHPGLEETEAALLAGLDLLREVAK